MFLFWSNLVSRNPVSPRNYPQRRWWSVSGRNNSIPKRAPSPEVRSRNPFVNSSIQRDPSLPGMCDITIGILHQKNRLHRELLVDRGRLPFPSHAVGRSLGLEGLLTGMVFAKLINVGRHNPFSSTTLSRPNTPTSKSADHLSSDLSASGIYLLSSPLPFPSSVFHSCHPN